MIQDKLWKSVEKWFSETPVSADLRSTALENLRKWLDDRRFAEARPQLEGLIRAGNFASLFDAFFRQIPFGTGGRRGPVGFGTNRINLHTVATSAQGHAEFLKARHPDRKDPGVVIAFDVRVFKDLRGVYDRSIVNPLLDKTSGDFARIAAGVYAANRIRVWFPEPGRPRYLSTPELSFTIRFLGAVGGLNVSASHNHPDDNGAKVYNEHGGQEPPPLDEEIARRIGATDSARSISWEEAVEDEWIRWIPGDAYDAYIQANLNASLDPRARSARVVFTPLHGTGWGSVGVTLEKAGFAIRPVPSQEKPDGTFPNAPFRSPNPEVPESLQAGTELAREIGADLVLGADPDADRLGMVVADPGRGWTFLKGNEIGILLAAYLLDEGKAAEGRKNPFALTTVVSTTLFSRITRAHGVHTFSDLPVGFKYIASIMNEIDQRGRFGTFQAGLADFVIGFEESFGYLVIPEVRDKDAAGAALLLAELASRLKDRGKTLLDYLDDVYRKYVCVRNVLISTVMLGARGFLNIRKIQASLRDSPPERISGRKVLNFIDRWDESGPLGKIRSETDRDARDMLILELQGDARAILRPSGTESKNKLYVEVRSDPLGRDATADALRKQEKQLDGIGRTLAEDFTLEALSRIGVKIPRYALDVSDLVPLEYKQDFADRFLPELVDRLQQGETPAELGPWVDSRVKPYGTDGRLLVRGGVESYCREKKPHEAVRAALDRIFK